jgi:hypothetical protein
LGKYLKAVPFLIVLLVAAAFASTVQTCLSTPRLIFTVPPVKFILCPDVNSDGHVDMKDVNAVIGSYGTVSGSAGWNPEADINRDGKIDIYDVVLVTSALKIVD